MRRTRWCVTLVGLLAELSSPRVCPASFDIEDVFAQPLPWKNNLIENSQVQMVLDQYDQPHLVIKAPDQGIFYATRNAAGWTIERIDTTFIGTTRYGDKGSIALGPDGVPHVVYWDPRAGTGLQLYYKRRGPLDANGFWPPRQPVHTGEFNVLSRTSIAVDSQNRVHLAFATTNRLWYAERADTTWSVPLPMDTIFAAEPSLALSPQGEPLIAYNDQTRAFLARRSGGTWSTGLVVEPASSDAEVNPSLAMTPGGEPVIAFSIQGGVLGYISHEWGWWTPYSSANVGGGAPCVAYGPQVGAIIGHINGSHQLIKTAVRGTNLPSEPVSSEEVLGENFWLAVGSDSRVHVVYQVSGTQGMVLRYGVECPLPECTPVGVEGPSSGSMRPALSIHPNPSPVGAAFSLTLAHAGATRAKVEVLDVQGRRMLDREVGLSPSGETVVSLSMPGARAGVYSVRVTGERTNASTKVVLLP